MYAKILAVVCIAIFGAFLYVTSAQVEEGGALLVLLAITFAMVCYDFWLTAFKKK